MPIKAKLDVAIMTALAGAILAIAASRWDPENLGHFVLFFALAMVGSAMKIRLPCFKTTISTNFVFILVGLALFRRGILDLAYCPRDAGIAFHGSHDGAGSLCLRGAEYRARLARHFLGGGTPPHRDLVLLLRMDVPVLPCGGGISWSGQRREPRQQSRRTFAGCAGDVFCLRLLPDAHRPRRTRQPFQREPGERSLTCWFISRPLSLFPGILA